jgi:predicted adenine nucleotide alpha hydrolase (AANH) superfamily ATPase
MKYLIIILFFFSCCTPKKVTVTQTVRDTVTIYHRDTIQLVHLDTLYLTAKTDSLQKIIHQLNTKLFLSNYKVERVRYYLKICQRNPSQTKFLVSWISRAIN